MAEGGNIFAQAIGTTVRVICANEGLSYKGTLRGLDGKMNTILTDAVIVEKVSGTDSTANSQTYSKLFIRGESVVLIELDQN